jgi:hypothetical protein
MGRAGKEEVPGIVNDARFSAQDASCNRLAAVAVQKHRVNRHPQAAREGWRETKTAAITGISWEGDLRDIDHIGLITVLR